MNTANEEMSKRLHELLDVIGASEFTRKKYWEFAMIHEILITFINHFYFMSSNKKSYYIVGSRCEGTTTPGLSSDIDKIDCDEDTTVVDNDSESKYPRQSLLILIDEDIKPGYVHLQVVRDQDRLPGDMPKEGYSKFDHKGRVCLIHITQYVGTNTTRNGPADTIPAGYNVFEKDIVSALRYRQIPRSANSWLHRTRKNDWPSQEQLNVMGSYDCFLVGVGHPHSDNKSIEWRISFTLQERYLMSHLTETQHKCYILLKMIKKDIIESNVGKSISSYHCKTSLFYTIENSQRHIWKEGNLILCARLCLIRILKWVKAKHCPNYFIPEENMFDKFSHKIPLKNIEKVLSDIIKSGVNFLYSIKCDNVGKLLESKLSISELVNDLGNASTKIKNVYIDNAQYVYIVRDEFLEQMYDKSSDQYKDYMKDTMQLFIYLQNTTHVTEHTTDDVRLAIDCIIPHIQLQNDQCQFAQYLSMRSKTIPTCISKTRNYDLISSKLSHASLYIQYEQFEDKCKGILVSCEHKLEPHVISLCVCSNDKGYINPDLAEKLRDTDMSFEDFRRTCTTGCMVFHPSQVNLVHAALQYEMFRNVFTQPGSICGTGQNYWLRWITVDSQIYLYFLQYLLYSKIGKRAEKDKAVKKLFQIILADQNLGHRETGTNLLGWIYVQENEIHAAWILFCISWNLRPFNNAAKWHMAVLLSRQINGK